MSTKRKTAEYIASLTNSTLYSKSQIWYSEFITWFEADVFPALLKAAQIPARSASILVPDHVWDRFMTNKLIWMDTLTKFCAEYGFVKEQITLQSDDRFMTFTW